MTEDARQRLVEARRTLDQAEAAAAGAAARRETDAAPIRAALMAHALLAAAPPAGRTLSALSAAIGDDAHALRLRIGPDAVDAEIVAPDAAALAAMIGGVQGFRSAKLKTAARVDQATGLQRAQLAIIPEAAR